LGVTAFEVFTFGLPWERSLNSEETIRRHLNEPPRQVQALNPDLDNDIAQILMKAIAKDREMRYRSVAEFRDALMGAPRDDY
jgi:eukaryotic-like serine/threonine-protein kinase